MKPVILTIFISLCAALVAGVIGRSQKHNRVESKLAEMASTNATVVLEEARFKDVDLNYDHLTGMLTGTVTSADDKVAIKSLLEKSVGAGRINNEQIQIVIPKTPAMVNAIRNGDSIVLSGVVESPDVRAAIQKVVESDGVSVKNDLTVGEHTDSIAPKSALFAALRGVLSGSKNSYVALNKGNLEVGGQLARPAKKAAILKEMGELGGVFLTHSELIDPPALPARLKLVSDGNQIELSGLVPTTADRDIIISSVKSTAPEGSEVIDNITVQKDVTSPAWLAGSAGLVSKLVGNVDGAGLEIAPGKFEVTGMAKNQAAAKDLAAGFSDLKTGASFTNGIKIPAPKIPAMVKVANDGAALNLTGVVPNQGDRDALVNAFSGSTDSRKVTDNLKISKDVVRAGWLSTLPVFAKVFYGDDAKVRGQALEIERGKMVLKGEIASAEAKADMLALADPIRESGIEVVDQLTVAKPAPKPKPKPQIPASLTAAMEGRTLNLSGVVPNKADRDAIVKAANALPSKPTVDDQIKIGDNTATAGWVGEFPKLLAGFFANGAAKSIAAKSGEKLVLKGELPTKEVKAGVLAGANVFKKSGIEVVDQLTIAPVKMAVVVPKPTRKTEPKSEPKPKMSETKLEPKPVAVKPAPKMAEAGKALPEKKVAIKKADEVEKPAAEKAAEIKKDPNAELVNIYFNTNSSLLRESQVGAFFKAMDTARAEGATIVLYGYADKRGSSDYNKRLSSRRNDKIKKLMIKHGISPDQIKTVAMGEADSEINDRGSSSRTLKQSRRVEIQISK